MGIFEQNSSIADAQVFFEDFGSFARHYRLCEGPGLQRGKAEAFIKRRKNQTSARPKQRGLLRLIDLAKNVQLGVGWEFHKSGTCNYKVDITERGIQEPLY